MKLSGNMPDTINKKSCEAKFAQRNVFFDKIVKNDPKTSPKGTGPGQLTKKKSKNYFWPTFTKLISRTKTLKKFFDLPKFLPYKMLHAFRFIAAYKVVQPAQIVRYHSEN